MKCPVCHKVVRNIGHVAREHKAWLKKVRRVNVNMLRIVKAEPQETPEPRAEDLGSGPRELRLGVERP